MSSTVDPGVISFLWRYFRRYLPWGAGAIVASITFALTTVMLLAIFRPILSEVLLAGGEPGASVLLGAAGDDASKDGGRIDLDGFFERSFERFQSAAGIDQHNIVWALPLIFVVIFLLRSLATFANGYLFQIIGLGATNDLRNDLYRRILHQSSRFFAGHPSGELVSRVSNDVSVMQNAVSNRLLDLFQQALTLALLIWFLLSIHLKMALICLVLGPAVLVPIVRFGQGMRRTTHHSQERLADLANLVAEAVRGHRVVKAFGMEGFELTRFRAATRRHLKMRLKAQLLSHGSGPVIESMAAIGAAAVLIYAGNLVRTGELTPSQVVQFVTNLVMLYDPIRRLNKVNLLLQEALAAGQRVMQVMLLPNDVEDRPGAGDLPELARELRFEEVIFAYEDTEVLKGIDLTIPRGQVVALVGPSGGGKSTLVNLLPRFFDPDRGRVLIDGTDVREVTLESLRAQIGLVTQDTMLFNDSVRNNIAYGRSDLPLEAVREAARSAYADGFISEMKNGYESVIGESGVKLSGGERQRLAIARALLKDPPILILDEATSHLDTEAESLVQKALHNLMSGRTALVIAHRLSTVQRVDRILVMVEGRIVEEGTHRELLAAGGVYKRLYDLQFRDAED